VVLGDLNDFQFSDTVHILEGGGSPVLYDMIDTLPLNEQYSYEFEGNAQVLDHILVSKGILDGGRTFDVVHINAEFSDQLSDHDPSVLKVAIQPTVDNLCAYVAEIVQPAGLANSLCVKLRHGQLAAFAHEVDAQAGKALTDDQAELLKGLAKQL
jgi:hypothetical protein